jgi:YidC/Oxa1 family membrane protein insertase
MERRALIAVVLSLLILVVYQEVVLKRIYPPPPPGAPGVPEAVPGEAVEELPPLPVEPAEPAAPSLAEAAPAVPAVQGRRITVETELYRAEFTTAGARLASLQLKEHRTAVDADSPPQEMIVASPRGELPFGVELRGESVVSDGAAVYTTEANRLVLAGEQSGHLDFVWRGESGTIRKRFTFHGNRYDFSAAVEAEAVREQYRELGVSWIRAIDAGDDTVREPLFDRTAFLQGKKLIEYQFDDETLSTGEIQDQGDIGWSGYAGRYFLVAMVPVEPGSMRLWLKARDGGVLETLLFRLASGAIEQEIAVYVGPKDLEILDRFGSNVARAVDLGWFSFVAIPLLQVLRFSHRFTSNYGADIVLLTILIKILFIPLTKRSFESMRAMQKLQPEMTKIRERYKDDSERMNKEVMELYRRHKVNPLGGCLPMVLQIPVFIGLYQALLNAVEFRHAPFMLWINDLSAPDRLGSLQLPFVDQPGVPVLTLLMGASMFGQQWMTPTTGDPAQQRIMLLMPLMFTFMFVNFPSGLSLYWLINNVLTIAQQVYINRQRT